MIQIFTIVNTSQIEPYHSPIIFSSYRSDAIVLSSKFFDDDNIQLIKKQSVIKSYWMNFIKIFIVFERFKQLELFKSIKIFLIKSKLKTLFIYFISPLNNYNILSIESSCHFLSHHFRLLSSPQNVTESSLQNYKYIIEIPKMDELKNQLPNSQFQSIQEIRYGLNEISLPYLERNQLGNYFKSFPELKEIGFEGCKKKLSQGIQQILVETKKNTKCLIHPSQSRSRYVQLQKWLITRLESLQQPQAYKQLSTVEYIEEQKKLIISTYLQLQDMFTAQCKEKSKILKLITTVSLQIINTLLIQLQNTSANMLVGYLKQKNNSEKELIQRISSLEKTIEILDREKNNKWKNLYIVVKDNRVLKKQNTKLLKMLNSEQGKVRILNQEHLKIKDQNEKFKLFLSSQKEEQTKKLSNYVKAKVQINQIDRLIKLYPKQAQKIAYAELKNIQMSEKDTLQQKISHIIKAIEKSGELVHQKDQGDDFLDTNKAKMCFNISIQTQKNTKDFSTNTYNKVLISQYTQISPSLKHNHLNFVSNVISNLIKPFKRQQAQNVQKKKTKPSMTNLKNNRQKENKQQSARQGSIKDMISTKKVHFNDDFLIFRTVNFRYLPDLYEQPAMKKKSSIIRRRDSSQSSFSTSSDKSDRIKKEKSVKFQNTTNEKRTRDISDSNIKYNQSKIKTARSKEKRVARFQNLHTYSSKSKIKDFRLLESELWKINKTYNLSIKQPNKFCQNVFVSTYQTRNKNKKVSVIQTYTNNTQKFFLTTFPGALKTFHQQKDEDENYITNFIEKQPQNANENKNIPEVKIPEAVNKKIYQFSKQKIVNDTLELRKNPSKISNASNQPKTIQKKSITKNFIPKSVVKKRERQQSQESLLSVSTGNHFFENRLSFQKDLREQTSKNESIQRQIVNQNNERIIKRSSQFSTVGSNNFLKANKFNRQTSVVLNNIKNPHMRLRTQMGPKRDSDLSLIDFAQNSKHLRTKTQGIDQIEETLEEQMITTFKHLRGSVERIKDVPVIQTGSDIQNEFEKTLKPKRKLQLLTLGDMERFQKIDPYRYNIEDEQNTLDLVKSIERVVKSISQRSVEIIKKDYLFKQFLLSFYQLQYGNVKQNIPKSYVQFLKELKKSKYSSNPMVQCLYILMNQSLSQVYRRDIFKLFTIIIEKNGGSLTDNGGEHQFYKKIMNEMLEIFIESTDVESVTNPMCLQQLKGNLSDYFMAIEGEIRKRSVNSQLYTFMIENVLQFGETSLSFEIIKEITFFITQGNKKVKNHLIQLRMYSETYIELHRLCLIVGRLKFNQLMEIGNLVQKKYSEIEKATGLMMSRDSIVNQLAKQKFDNFPYLKQTLHRQIQSFYKYNLPISEPLLKLCHVNLFSQKLQNESPISDCLKAINQQTQKLQRLKYYKQVLENTSKL